MSDTDIPEGIKLDRLFVPLSTRPYRWFKQGRKKWELRTRGGNFTTNTVYFNRHVELRKGYSSSESVWGKIKYTLFGDTIEEILDEIPFYEIIPEASSRSEAINEIRSILDTAIDNGSYIAFRVDSEIERIELDPAYTDDILSEVKTTTIRRGHRDYDQGPALLQADNLNIPVHIDTLQYTTRSELDTRDAMNDGFDNLSELQSALEKHYPEIESDAPVTIVSFELARSEE